MLSPLGDRILVQKIDQIKMINGIHIPDSAVDEELKANVVAVGPGKKQMDGTCSKMPVKAGDVIVYMPFSGSETNIDGQKYIVLKSEDIAGICDDI